MFEIFMNTLVNIINEDINHWRQSKMKREYRQEWTDYYINKLRETPKFKKIKAVRGGEKMTFIFSTFVIKVYLSYSVSDENAEYNNYIAAVDEQLDMFFPETFKPKTFELNNGQIIIAYQQKICKGQNQDKNLDFAQRLYRKSEIFAKRDEWKFLDDILGPVVAEFYPVEKLRQLSFFCLRRRINDMHAHNFVIQPRKREVKIYDFSGYSWW